jgi:hypothetical protein
VRSKTKLMDTLVHITVGRVYSLSRRKDECVERRRRQLRYSSKGSQHKGVAAGLVLTDYPHWHFHNPARPFKVDLSKEDRAAILCENAVALFRLNMR